MLKYFKTDFSVPLIQKLLHREIQDNKPGIVLNEKISSYLKTTYDVNIYQVIDALDTCLRVKKYDRFGVLIWFMDEPLGNSHLKEISKFLDYGTLEIPCHDILSNYMNYCILKVRAEELG